MSDVDNERVEWHLIQDGMSPRGVLKAYKPRTEGEKLSTKHWIKFPLPEPRKTDLKATFKVWLDNCWESSPINDGL